jgi:hypothetical protein
MCFRGDFVLYSGQVYYDTLLVFLRLEAGDSRHACDHSLVQNQSVEYTTTHCWFPSGSGLVIYACHSCITSPDLVILSAAVLPPP